MVLISIPRWRDNLGLLKIEIFEGSVSESIRFGNVLRRVREFLISLRNNSVAAALEPVGHDVASRHERETDPEDHETGDHAI